MASELFKLVGTISIDVTSATQNINAVITAGEDLENKLNNIGANADSSIGSKSGFGAASVWLGNMLTELTNRAAQLGREFALAGLKYNAAMEGYEVTFGTLLNGDVEKAKQLMANITNFALNSPLNVTGVSAAALQLLNVGTAYEDVIPTLKMLGDLSLGDAEKMNRLSTALAQVMGFGQLYGQEKQQFVNAGVPIYKLLEDYYKIVEGMDTTGLDLDKMQRDGAILSEHVFGALQLATMSDEEILEKYGYSGERAVSFYDAMAAMLPTYTGQTQKAGEQTEVAAGAVVKPYQDVATNSVIPAYTEMMAAIAEKYKDDEDSKKVAENVGGFVTSMLNSLTDAISGKYNFTAPENEENLTPFGKFITGIYSFEDLWNALRQKEIDQDAEDKGGGRRFGTDGNAKGNGSVEDTPSWADWIVFDNDTQNRKFGTPSIDLDGVGGSNGNVGMLAALLQQLSTLKSDVTAAVKEGAAEGVSGITVNGYVTTGDVKLGDDTIGTFAQMLDLKLGQAESKSNWG